MKKILIGSILLVTALSVSNANIKQITTIDATTNKNVVSDINSLISSYIDEDSRYTKDTEIFVNEIAKEQLLKNNGFHGNASSLKRSTHYKDNALWMSRSKEDVGVKYSYYGTDTDGNLTYGTSESPLVEPIDIVVAASYENRETNDKWHNKTIEGMEGYYITLKDIIAKEEHNWEFDNNFYYSTNSEVIEWFKAFTAPCYLGFKDIENKEYIPLDKVSIHTDNNNNLVLSLYSSEATSILTSNNGVFSQALIRKAKTMACLGDSITLGSRVVTPFPKLIENKLDLKKVYNFGIGSSTLTYSEKYNPMCVRYSDMPDDLDIIFVMGGVNDYSTNKELGKYEDINNDTFYADLKTMVKGLKNKYEESFIFFATPYRMVNDTIDNLVGYNLADYVLAIKQVCADYDIPILDLYNDGKLEENFSLNTFDGIHPTQYFYENYTAPQISNFIKEKVFNDNNEYINWSNMNYLAFGDSITSGDGLESSSYAYPHVVGNELGCKVTNKGVSGSTLADIKERHCIANDVDEVCNGIGMYDVISVMGGTNDIWWNPQLGNINDYTTDTIYGSLNIIANELTTTFDEAFIFFMTPIMNTSFERVTDNGYDLEDIANAVIDVGNKYNIPVLDMYRFGRFEEVKSGMNNPNCDGTHPLKEYIDYYMAPQIANFIRNNISTKNQNNANKINWSDLDYVAYGDSITYGSEWCNQYKQMETPYPTQVKNILGLNSVNNQAISGATASKHESLYCMSERILRYTGGDAIISVMIGVNDFNRSQPLGKLGDDDLKTIYGALNKTMKHLKQTCQDSYIFYMTPYKENYSGYTHQSKNEANYYLNDVRMAIIETAKIYDIDVLDLYKYGRFEEVMYNSDCDGIHPNQDFVLSHTAPQIAEFIKRNFN